MPSAAVVALWALLCAAACIATTSPSPQKPSKYSVPNIVHQTYDYQSPNFFLFLSIMTVQRFLRPDKHILWVNDEGRYRRGHWESWQKRAAPDSWERVFVDLLSNGSVEARLRTFPAHPPGNTSTFAPNKAHRSDFVRMAALQEMGGIYLDTDAYALRSLDELRVHDFVLGFDNIVNPDPLAPKRLNNGVLLSKPQAAFLDLWMKEYAKFNPSSFDHDSSVVPYRLATQYPDLVHIEWNRLSPTSFGFQTSVVADALTCGLYVPPTAASPAAIWYPRYLPDKKAFTFEGTQPDSYMARMLENKLVLHLTMSQVRGICMMRKQLNSPADLQKLPSFLGHVFRTAYFGRDDYDYSISAAEGLSRYKECRDFLGMYTPPEVLQEHEHWVPHQRQQYQLLHAASGAAQKSA